MSRRSGRVSDEAAYRQGVREGLALAAEMATKLGAVDQLVVWCRDQARASLGPCSVCHEPHGRHRDLRSGRYVTDHVAPREGLLL